TRNGADAKGAPASTGKRLAWLDLNRAHSRIATPTAAFMAVAQQAGLDNDQVERFMEQLGREGTVTPGRAAELAGSDKLINDAALLYAAARHEAASAETEKRSERFVTALAREALQQQLFSPGN